ncbi:MAG: glycosyltransferase family 4 protein [Saprospiraceae bacterium]|nr:glycosyltransferase family 4 protein [Lewinella sp.]
MRLLFVLENYYPNIGGVETLFKQLIGQLVAAGHECTVITSLLQPEHPRQEQKDGLTIIRIPVPNRYLFTLYALWPVLRNVRSCDLVQTTSYNAALPAFIGAVLFRRKVVITFHEAWGRLWFRLPFMSRFSQLAHYLFEQLLLRLPFDLFIAVSQSTAGHLAREGVPAKRIKTIYNGLDYSEFMDRLDTETVNEIFTYTYFGRLGISKGLDVLLNAAHILKERSVDFRLQLITPLEPEPLLAQIKKLTDEYGLKSRTIWHHHLSFTALKQVLLASDCVVIPSYSEGFCYAAAEAVALGVPVISSSQGALPEVVSGQHIFMKSFSAEALAESMYAATNGEWETRPLRRFELSETVKAYIQTYKGLIKT